MEEDKVEVLDEEKKENKENKENKNGLGPAFMVILVVLFLVGGVLGFAASKLIDEAPKKDKPKEVEKEKKEKKEELDITDSLVVNLFNTFRIDNACWKSAEEFNKNNVARLRLAFDNLNVEYDQVPCSKVGATRDNMYCGEILWGSDTELSDAYTNNKERFKQLVEERVYTKFVKQADLKAKVFELFGTDYEYKDADFGLGHSIDTGCTMMHYEEKLSGYVQYTCEGGGTCGLSSQKVDKAYKEGDKLFIETTLTDPNGVASKANYEFKKDAKNSNYVFVEIKEEN